MSKYCKCYKYINSSPQFIEGEECHALLNGTFKCGDYVFYLWEGKKGFLGKSEKYAKVVNIKTNKIYYSQSDNSMFDAGYNVGRQIKY